MDKELLQMIKEDLFENNYRAKERFRLNGIIDEYGNMNSDNLRTYIWNDALEFKEMLDEEKIPVDMVLDDMRENYQFAAEFGIVYTIYFYCLDLGYFLPDMLKAFAVHGLLKTYCAVFWFQFGKHHPNYILQS